MRFAVLLVALSFSSVSFGNRGVPSLVSKAKQRLSVVKDNPFVSKLWRGFAISGTALILTCGSMSCSELGISGEDYDSGDRIYYVRGGLAYGGTVLKDLGDDQYLVKVNDTSLRTTIDEDEVRGVYNPDRDDYEAEGQAVVLLGDRDGVKYRHGVLKRFYDDGFVELRMTHETMFNDDLLQLSDSYTIFIDEDASLQEGGFVLGDFI